MSQGAGMCSSAAAPFFQHKDAIRRADLQSGSPRGSDLQPITTAMSQLFGGCSAGTPAWHCAPPRSGSDQIECAEQYLGSSSHSLD
jgi:hypothetical protein